MAAQILRLKRTDKSGQHLLVHIAQSGSKPLDLKLIGTEHEHLYHTTIKESNAKALQVNTFAGDLEEWKQILKAILLHQKPEGSAPTSLQGIELVAAISGTTLTITLRKNVEGITQRLGSIKLEQDDEREEVSPFEWVDLAVANGDALRTELEALQSSVSTQQDEVAKLTKQLDELVQAKKEHEEELLKKFAALLNAKKLKIRDQQRLLAGAKIDPNAAKAVGSARNGSTKGSSTASRSGKRKAEAVDDVDDDQVEDANDNGASEDDEAQQETPPRSEDEETDDGDLDGPTKASETPGRPKVAGSRNQSSDEPMDVDGEDLEPPPRRELPAYRKASPPRTRNSQAGSVTVDGGGNDDDETDDEL